MNNLPPTPSSSQIEDIKNLVTKLGPVSPKVWLKVIPHIRIHRFPKNEILVPLGVIEDKLYLVLNGTLGLCLLKDGKEYFVDFRLRGQFATAIISFITQQPSELGLKTIKPCIMASIPRDVLYNIFEKDHGANYLARKYYEDEFAKQIRRANEIYIYNAEERYLRLLKYKPNYAKEIPLKYLASYLGIEAESLSRIRARLTKENKFS